MKKNQWNWNAENFTWCACSNWCTFLLLLFGNSFPRCVLNLLRSLLHYTVYRVNGGELRKSKIKWKNKTCVQWPNVTLKIIIKYHFIHTVLLPECDFVQCPLINFEWINEYRHKAHMLSLKYFDCSIENHCDSIRNHRFPYSSHIVNNFEHVIFVSFIFVRLNFDDFV